MEGVITQIILEPIMIKKCLITQNIHGNKIVLIMIQLWVIHRFIKIDMWEKLHMFILGNHMDIQSNI
jgi:hypothetical protein